jgi:hypothetical protein
MGVAHRAARLKIVLKFIGFNLAENGIGEAFMKTLLAPERPATPLTIHRSRTDRRAMPWPVYKWLKTLR